MSSSSTLIAARYRLTRLLGEGGMGRVWLAQDVKLNREVAVKEIIPPKGLTDRESDEARRRTLREARTAASLAHPNVVRVFDTMIIDDQPWIVMEYVPSRSLQAVIDEDGPLPPRRVAEIGLAVLGALRTAHTSGVLHRDVKPANVLLADDGRVVLTDFGLATFDGEAQVTRTGVILGSPQFISPERASKGVSLPESDLWSFGATLFAAVEGQAPYHRPNAIATLTALVTEDPDPCPHAGPLQPVLEALLRKEPAHRPSAAVTERWLRRIVAEGRRRPAGPAAGAKGTEAGEGTGGHLRRIPKQFQQRLFSLGRPEGPPPPPAAGSPVPVPPVPVPPAPPAGAPAPPEAAQAVSARPPSEPTAPVHPAPEQAGPEQAAPARPEPGPAQEAPEATMVVRAGPPGPAGGAPPMPAPTPPPSPGAGSATSQATTTWYRHRYLQIAAVALAVLLVLILAVRAMDSGGRRAGGPGQPAPSTSAAAPSSQVAPQGNAAPSAPAPSGATTEPDGPAAGPAGGGSDIPAGWVSYQDSTGFRIAVPGNWTRSRSGSMVVFREPGTGRSLSIDQTTHPKGDTYDDWIEQEKWRSTHLSNYHRIKLVRVPDCFQQCADWEYTYTDNNGSRLHVLDRNIISGPSHAYALFWLTPDALWQQGTDMFAVFARTFQPAP